MALRKIFTGLALAATALFAANSAYAVTCESLPGSVTYVAGSSASGNVWLKTGQALFDAGITVVYVNPANGSCDGTRLVESYGDAGILPGTGNGTFYIDGGKSACDITPANSGAYEVVNLGASDVDQGTCDLVDEYEFLQGTGSIPIQPTNPAPTIGNFDGPNQVMEIIQPNTATTNAISAEQAFYVFQGQSYGPGAVNPDCATTACQGGGVAPWDQPSENATTGLLASTPPAYLFLRNEFSGTQNMIGQAINLFSFDFVGVNAGSAVPADVAQADGMGAAANSTLGILVAGTADPLRSSATAPILPVAFRSYDQYTGAWFPDSTSTASDKANVREGRYSIFGSLQFFYNVDTTGAATDPKASALLSFLNGTTPLNYPDPKSTATPPAPYTIDAAFIDAATIPSCAMSVTRTPVTLSYTDPTSEMTYTYTSRNSYNNLAINGRAHSCDNFFNCREGVTGATCTACTNPLSATNPTGTDTACTGATPVCGVDSYCEAY